MSRKLAFGVLWCGEVPIYFTITRKLRGPRWRKARRHLRRQAR